MNDNDTLNQISEILDEADGAASDSAGAAPESSHPDAEADILRHELSTAREALRLTEAERDEAHAKFLRARADLENLRRRALADNERARETGLDSAVLTVLAVFDDLGRALDAADEDDPSKIIPGVRAVREGLERNLESLGIVRVGAVGDRFDPDVHEALSAVPTDDPERIDTIAQVYQAGFTRGDRLVRPARVVVFQAG